MTTRKLSSLTNELKIADAALQEWKGKDEPLSATMVMQYELLKQELLKDLTGGTGRKRRQLQKQKKTH
jgi:hypothetical protein